MELGETKAHLGYAIQCRRGDDATEGSGHAITGVIGHDEEYIWGTFGRNDLWRPVWCRVLGAQSDLSTECRWRTGKVATIDRGGRICSTRDTIGLLSLCRRHC